MFSSVQKDQLVARLTGFSGRKHEQKCKYTNAKFGNAIQILYVDTGSDNTGKNSKKNWYPFCSRTRWHRLTFLFLCSSPLGTTKDPGNNSTDNHRTSLKGGRKRADCLGTSNLRSNTTVSFLSFLFIIHYPVLCSRKARDPSFFFKSGAGVANHPLYKCRNQQTDLLQ